MNEFRNILSFASKIVFFSLVLEHHVLLAKRLEDAGIKLSSKAILDASS
jgi:hypothetical protein